MDFLHGGIAFGAAFLAVTGCYAQTGAEALRKLKDIDLIVGAQHKMQLPQYLTALKRRPAPELLHTRTIGRDAFTMEGIGEYQETRANLKVQDGCNFMCSFCIIPFSRGHERSRSMDDILREAEGLVSRGHREVVLTGVNVGRYEFKGRTLADVVRSLEPVGGLDRIRISSIEPTTITDELLELMAGPSKLCPYLHVPLQSGDDMLDSCHLFPRGSVGHGSDNSTDGGARCRRASRSAFRPRARNSLGRNRWP